MTADDRLVGAELRKHRLLAGVSQADLAGRSGLSERAIRDLENGRIQRPRIASLRLLAEALDLPADALGLAPRADSRDRLTISLLGPLRVSRGPVAVEIGPPRLRLLLVLLALHVDGTVPVELMAQQVWPGRRPDRWLHTLQADLSRLRRNLGASAEGGPRPLLTKSGKGYRLLVPADDIDAFRFARLVRQAESIADKGDAHQAFHAYDQALSCWRGAVLEGEVSRLDALAAIADVRRLRLSATLAYSDLALRTSLPRSAEARLRALLDEEPLHEGLHARLLQVLGATNRRAEAISGFLAIRGRLVEELGVEPGPALQEAYVSILRSGQADTSEPITVAAEPPPQQLPLDVEHFAGRQDAVADLTRVTASAVPVAVVTGIAGVGKTALCVHWAHLHRAGYPDGQLWANLRGYDAGGRPADPLDVLGSFLRVLDPLQRHIPSDIDEASARFRTLIASRRMLIILDDAYSSDQVRPLLPGVAGCSVLITSRTRLDSLIARDGATWIVMAELERRQALSLVEHAIGDTVTASQEELAMAVDRCAGLPLALRLAAAYLQRSGSVDEFTAAMRKSPLETLDRYVRVHEGLSSAFDVSFHALSADARRAFRVLHVLPTKEFDAYSITAMLGRSYRSGQQAINELLNANLLTLRRLGRMSVHDLLNAHSRKLCTAEEAHDATAGLLNYLMQMTYTCIRIVYPNWEELPLRACTDTEMPAVTGAEHAARWLDSEWELVVEAVRIAYEIGDDVASWQLACFIAPHLRRHRYWSELIASAHTALPAAIRCGDHEATVRLHNVLSNGYQRTSRWTDAENHLRRALEIAHRSGNTATTGTTNNLASVYVDTNRPELAIGLLEPLLRRTDYAGNSNRYTAGINLTCAYIDVGNYTAAEREAGVSLQLALDAGDLVNAGYALYSLAEIALRRADYPTAADIAGRLIDVARRAQSPIQEASGQHMLASAMVATDLNAATDLWQKSRDMYARHSHGRAAVLDRWLQRLPELEIKDILRLDTERRRESARTM